MAEQKKERETKGRVGYGVKPPQLSFQQSIATIKDVSKLGGESGSLDAMATVLDNSRSSSTFYYKLGVLKNFGLITFDKLNYNLTEIGGRIVTPESLTDEYKAIHEAFCQHETLKQVWENYKGKLLPQKEYLANYFEKSIGIPAEFKLQWAEYFIDAVRYAKIVVERGDSGSLQVLFEPQISVQDSKKTEPLDKKPEPDKQKNNDSIGIIIEANHWGILNQRKISGNRKAIFAIPDELTQDDIDMLRVILKGVDAGLDGLKKSERND